MRVAFKQQKLASPVLSDMVGPGGDASLAGMVARLDGNLVEDVADFHQALL